MGRERINPPKDALADIERLAQKGYSTVGLAKHFKVSRSVIVRWFEDERFEETYEQWRDSYRQTIEEQIIAMTMANKNPSGLIYLLKAKFKMYDVPPSAAASKIDVSVNEQRTNVMVVTDFGSDKAWQAKAIEQQRNLAALAGSVSTDESDREQLEGSHTPSAPAAYTMQPLTASEGVCEPPKPQYGPPQWVGRC